MWWNNDHSYVPVQSWYVNINISSFSVASNLQTPALLAHLAGGSIAMDTDFAVHTCRLSPKPNVHCLNFIAGTTRRVLHFSLLLLSLLLWFLQLTLVVRLVGIISVNWDTLLGSQVAEKHIVLDSNTGQGPLLHVIPYLPFPNAFFCFSTIDSLMKNFAWLLTTCHCAWCYCCFVHELSHGYLSSRNFQLTWSITE